MENQEPICNLNDTWEDALEEFKEVLKKTPTWNCVTVENPDKEGILSAPEIMDLQTDTGYGCQEVYSFPYLLKSGAIPAPSTFADEKSLVDIMDYLHERELRYLEGNSLVQGFLTFPFFFAIDELKEGNPVLYVYCKAMLGTLEYILRAAFSTTIRGDEEFLPAPPELDLHMNVQLEEVVAELEEIASRPTTSPAVAVRLRCRKSFLLALSLFLDGVSKEDMLKASHLCEEAADWLKNAPEYQRTSEPEVNPGLIREKELPFWVSIITPVSPIPVLPFKEVSAAYQTIFSQLASLKTLFTLPSLYSITEFIEDIASESPLILVRCVAVILLFGRDPTESFLFGLPLDQRLLETLAKNCGAPLYLKVFENHLPTVESVVRFRVHKTMDPLKVTPNQLASLRHQTVEMMHRWVAEAGKHYLVHLEIMLCNRGMAHRRLMNAIPALVEFQEVSHFADLSIFLSHIPGGHLKEHEQDASRVSKVLSFWASDAMLHAMELIVKFQVELDLLKDGEIIPALWYMSTVCRARKNNALLLCRPGGTVTIPENHINKKRVPLYNLSFTTRTQGEVDLPEALMLDINCSLADAQLLAACIAEKKGLMDFTSTGSASLTTAENTFNHRYLKCFGCIRKPAFASYRHCMASKPLITLENIKSEAQKASTIAYKAAEKAQILLKNPPRPLTDVRKRLLEKVERSARALVACLWLLGEEETEAKSFDCRKCCAGLPYFLSFSIYSKQTNQKILK